MLMSTLMCRTLIGKLDDTSIDRVISDMHFGLQSYSWDRIDVLVRIRGFAKLKKFQTSKRKLDRAQPTHSPSIQTFFFGNPSLTWTEHSNHNNQQICAMHTDRIHVVCYSKILALVYGYFGTIFQKLKKSE